MFTSFLIKYAEIGVKGNNRYLFEDALVRQIRHALKRCDGMFKVHKNQGRIYVDALSEFDFEETVEQLQTVFGISRSEEHTSELQWKIRDLPGLARMWSPIWKRRMESRSVQNRA